MKTPRVIAVAGGKGGTGKSLIAANVGVFLATLGKRVVLLDASFGSANLHAFVGVSQPSRTLADFLARKDGGSLEDVAVSTLVSGLRLIGGESDPAWASNPRPQQLMRLREQVRQLEADYVVVDLAPGTRENDLDLFLDADVATVVSSAEPTAIELAYRLIKAAFVRLLRRSELGTLAKMTVEEAREFEGGIAAPSDLRARALAVHGEDSPELRGLEQQMRTLVPHLILNTARSKADMELGASVAAAATRRFGLAVRYLGPVEYDDAVWVSLRRRRPLLVEHPESRASKCIEKLTRRALAFENEGARASALPGESYYALLDIEPTAIDEDIRRANRRVRQIYAKDSVVMRGLYSGGRLERLHRKLDDGYETLMDPDKRRAYDHALFPDGIPTGLRQPPSVREASQEPVAGERPRMPELADDVVFTGELMQRIREARGLDLREISERTKIGMGYLEAIEAEAFGKLPAPVYVRGFLVEYAKMLELDVGRVLDTYLPRYRNRRTETASHDSA